MAIITLATWKTLTGTSATTYDTQVAALIPYVQADFVDMCAKDFDQGTADEAFPSGCAIEVVQMINYRLQGTNIGNTGDSKISESTLDYSYTQEGATGGAGYPKPLERAIRLKYGRVSFKEGQIMTQYRDKRGFGPEALVK